MLDDVDARLNRADVYLLEGDETKAAAELLEAVRILSSEGSELLSSVSASEFEKPVFTILRRITAIFENLPDVTELISLIPDLQKDIPDTSASPAEFITAVTCIYEKAEDESEETSAPSFSVIETLIALLSGQQTFRSMLFAEDGLYKSAASAAAPYLAGAFAFAGDDFDDAVGKADSMLFGPLERLAELFYSLLTSSLTAGLLLLIIRRAIPFMRPSKKQTAVDAVMLTASNFPEIIKGLRAVYAELLALREIIRRKDTN